jgi:UDP-glucose 4-epimerase
MNQKSKPSVLIIGINGFIGQNCSLLLSNHYHIEGVATKPHNRFKTYIIDKTNFDIDNCFKYSKFDFCINAGGSSSVAWSFEHPDEDYLLTVVNTEKLVAAIERFNPDCKLIQLSSAAVYGNPEYLPVSENHPLRPISPYGRHKMQCEQLLSYSSIQSLSLRIFSAYGPGLRKQLFWDILQKASKGSSVKLFGTGLETRDFIYVDDLVEAIHLVIKNAEFNKTSINVASGKSVSIAEAAKVLIQHYNPRLEISFNNEQKAGDPLHWEADISKLKSFGFEPKFSMQEGLQQYVSWFIENAK